MLLLSMGILSLAMSIAAFEKGARADEPIVTVAPASSSQLVSVARPSTSYDELRRATTSYDEFSHLPLRFLVGRWRSSDSAREGALDHSSARDGLVESRSRHAHRGGLHREMTGVDERDRAGLRVGR